MRRIPVIQSGLSWVGRAVVKEAASAPFPLVFVDIFDSKKRQGRVFTFEITLSALTPEVER